MLNPAMRSRLLRYRAAARRLVGRSVSTSARPRFVPGEPLPPGSTDSSTFQWGSAATAPTDAVATPGLAMQVPDVSDLGDPPSFEAVAALEATTTTIAPRRAASPKGERSAQAPIEGKAASSRPPTTAELRDTLLSLRALRASAPPGDMKAPITPLIEPPAAPSRPRSALGRRVEHLPGFNPVAPTIPSAAPATPQQPTLREDSGEPLAASAGRPVDAQAEPFPDTNAASPPREPLPLTAPPLSLGLSTPASEPAAIPAAPPAPLAEQELRDEAAVRAISPLVIGNARQTVQDEFMGQNQDGQELTLHADAAPSLGNADEPAAATPPAFANIAEEAADREVPVDASPVQPALEQTPLSSPPLAAPPATNADRLEAHLSHAQPETEPTPRATHSATGDKLPGGASSVQTAASRPTTDPTAGGLADVPLHTPYSSLPAEVGDVVRIVASPSLPSSQPAMSQGQPNDAPEPEPEPTAEPLSPTAMAVGLSIEPQHRLHRPPSESPATSGSPLPADGQTAGPRRSAEAEPIPPSPLRESTRQLLRPLIGLDPADVPLHTGAAAAQTVEAHGAAAITTKAGVFLGAGRGEETAAGLALLAHELYHASRRPTRFVPPTTIAQPDPQEERSAEQIERQVALLARAQRPAAPPTPAGGPSTGVDGPDGMQPAIALPALAAPATSEAPGARPSAPLAEPAPHPIWGRLPAPGDPLHATSQPRLVAAHPEVPLPPMSGAPVPNSVEVQRAELQRSLATQQAATAVADTASVLSPATPEVDIDALAQQVYARLRRRLEAERRRGAV